MANRIREQLIQVKSDLRRKNKWEMQKSDYENELADVEKFISDLTNQLKEEKKDVEKLEGTSISGLFHSLFGNKDEKIEKEKQEVVAVQVELEEAKKTKKELEQSLKDIQYELEKLDNIEQSYQQLFDEKERMIKHSNSSQASKLYELSEEEGDVKAYLLELEEAITAGNRVTYDLESALSSLDSAANWGTLDMFGGGMISGLAKHGSIDEATAAIHRAQTSMRYFQKELLDVQEELDIHIDITGMLKFADFFLDGIFVDYMVQNKINESRDQVQSKKSEVERIIRNLKDEMKEKEVQLERIENAQQHLIENY
ncbi:hypothetical protein [Oceanobacillus halophilus]|uniref:Uncharacterized protein n=1 Tax=Oceanobacillus halophilus TaxID=930130 RepID=A0A495A6S2_9BACI|nr:hypothetical protein [Oceanobacillus halophilus]RKQ35520.1 hypothetical protein D8M06_04360 [Oceanobacillus halophilus]